jgi:hypothetical protein
MPNTTTPEIISFTHDMTLRWPCRSVDFLLWLGYRDIFSGPAAVECYNLWEMRDDLSRHRFGPFIGSVGNRHSGMPRIRFGRGRSLLAQR